MARKRNQGARRTEIIEAAIAVAGSRGLFGIRTRDVSSALGLTDGAVHYYFASLDDLRLEVFRAVVEKAFQRRQELVGKTDDPVCQLRRLLEASLPEEELAASRLLDEPLTAAAANPAFRAVAYVAFHREVARYEGLLERGVALGVFHLHASALDVARNLVALEDGYRLHIVVEDPVITRATALRLLLVNAGSAVGVSFVP